MKWNDFREKAGNKAGLLWKIGDGALLGKSFVENKFDITKILSLDTLAGALLVTAGQILHKKGDTHKGLYQGMGIAILGYAALISSQVAAENFASLPGMAIGVSSCIWSGASALYAEKQEKAKVENKKDMLILPSKDEQEKKKPYALKLFKQAKSEIVDKYPNLIPMTANAVSNAMIVAGSIKDQDWYLAGVGVLWTVGSTLMAISKQKTESTPAPKLS